MNENRKPTPDELRALYEKARPLQSTRLEKREPAKVIDREWLICPKCRNEKVSSKGGSKRSKSDPNLRTKRYTCNATGCGYRFSVREMKPE